MATFRFLSGIARPEILGSRELGVGGQVDTIARLEISERFRFFISGPLTGVQQLKTNPHDFSTLSCQSSVSKVTRASRRIQPITQDKMLEMKL